MLFVYMRNSFIHTRLVCIRNSFTYNAVRCHLCAFISETLVTRGDISRL